MSPLQLPGRIELRPRGSSAAPVYVALCALVVLGGGLFWLLRPSLSESPASPTSIQSASIKNSPQRDRTADEDEVHFANVRAQLTKASEQLVRAERTLSSLRPDLDRNYLDAERQRVDTASIACTTARAAIERALSELRSATLSHGDLK